MRALKFIIVGHIDHGKSTLIGRLLFDTNSLPEDRIKEILGGAPKEKKFANFLDYFEEEREQEMTVDTTQVFFRTKKREYAIIDAPGHREFIKNMISGASYAKIGVLIIDVTQGLKEQSRRHAYILSLLGIKQVIVVVNKMDLVDFGEDSFNRVKKETEEFLIKIEIKPHFYIPISALEGENIIGESKKMLWYNGLSFLEAIDSLETLSNRTCQDLIFSVQDVYKFNGRDIAVGRIESGAIKRGDLVRVLPQGNLTKIKSIEKFLQETEKAFQGESIGITIDDDFLLKRGDILCNFKKAPSLKERFKANVFLFAGMLNKEEKINLRCSVQETPVYIEKIQQRIDSSTLEIIEKDASLLECLDVGGVIVRTSSALVIKNFSENENLGRFVLVKKGTIFAGGVVTEVI